MRDSMRDRILEIVVFMVDFIQEKKGQMSSTEELSSTLKTMGYSDLEISSAYAWLMERFDDSPEKYFSDFPKVQTSNRVLTEYERQLLIPEAQGYLFKLLHLSLINQEQFEAVVERSTLFGTQQVTLDQLQMIISTVIFKDLDEVDQFTQGGTDNHTSIIIN